MNYFEKIPKDLKQIFLTNSKTISFSIGQVFCDFNDSPNGVLLIKKGDLRMVYKDKYNEIFTIHRFESGDIVGAEQILCGTTKTALKASSDVEAYFLSKNSFLKYLQNNYVDNGYFEDVFINEYLRILLVLENQVSSNPLCSILILSTSMFPI